MGGRASLSTLAAEKDRQPEIAALALRLTRVGAIQGTPGYMAEIWPRVASDLDQYAGEWQGVHREACLAHQRGETSGVLLDRRMACLARRKTALGEAQFDALRPRLARVRTLDHAGLTAMALAEADDVLRAAEQLGEPSLLSEALLQRGRLGIHSRDQLATGRHREAVEQLQLDLQVPQEGGEWWQKRHRAELQFQLGLGLQALGRRIEAGEALRAAVAGFEAAATNSRTVLLQQRLTGARVARGAQILGSEADSVLQAEADALLDLAEQFYRSSGPGYAWRLPDLSALRRRTRSP